MYAYRYSLCVFTNNRGCLPYVQLNAKKDEAVGYVFITRDWKTKARKLLVLIHGAGAPRAGEWSRKYVISCGHSQIGVSSFTNFSFSLNSLKCLRISKIEFQY